MLQDLALLRSRSPPFFGACGAGLEAECSHKMDAEAVQGAGCVELEADEAPERGSRRGKRGKCG